MDTNFSLSKFSLSLKVGVVSKNLVTQKFTKNIFSKFAIARFSQFQIFEKYFFGGDENFE